MPILRSSSMSGGVFVLPLAAALLASFVFCLPLLWHWPLLPSGDDRLFAAQSALGFADALREGILYPRWIETANAGLGAPTFIFYSPLVYYATGLASLLFGEVLAGLRWTLFALTAIGGLAFAFVFRRHGLAGAVAAGAALYVLAPYHAIDLYWRFALAEYAAFVWLPGLLVSTWRVVEGEGAEGVAGLAVSYAGLVLTHLVTAFLAPIALAPYLLVLLWRDRRWRRVPALLAAGGLGVALGGVFLVPLLVQRDFVQLEYQQSVSYGDYRRNFLLRDEVAFGGRKDKIKPLVSAAAATQASFAVLALGCVAVYRRRVPRAAKGSSQVCDGLGLGAVVVWTTLLQLPVSAPIWANLPELSTVQFPWRFQAFQVLAISALAIPGASTLAAVFRKPRGGLVVALMAASIASMLLVSAVAVRSRGFAFDSDDVREVAAGEVFFEYVPRGVPHWSQWTELWKAPERTWLASPGEVSIERWGTHERVLRVDTPGRNRLRVRTFAYPNWTARVDGEPTPIQRSSPMGMIEVEMEPGSHQVQLSFTRTGDRRAGALLSGVALAVLAMTTWRRGSSRRAPRRQQLDEIEEQG